MFEDWARRDPRVRLYSVAREGVYAGWNACLERATGDYVYFATSDDTMRPDCLSVAVDYLERYPAADWVHFTIEWIDQFGHVIPGAWRGLLPNQYYGNWLDCLHWRDGNAERDRMLFLGTVYFSVTELIMRKNSCPPFPREYGVAGDFVWALRHLPGKRVLHLPDSLATWRRRPGQATSFGRETIFAQLQMMEDFENIPVDILAAARAFRVFWSGLTKRRGKWTRLGYCLRNPQGRRLLWTMLSKSKEQRFQSLLRSELPLNDLRPLGAAR